MFLTLLLTTLGVALATAALVVFFFNNAIRQILERIIGDPVADAWRRFLVFAIFVVGVSSGVQIWKLEQYLRGEPGMPGPDGRLVAPKPFTVDAASMALEIYRTIIATLQGVAWALLVFFVVALIAFAIVRRGDQRKPAGA